MQPTRTIAAGDIALVLDTESYVPYYQQIVEQIREQIKAEKVNYGQTFYSESEVAQHLGISKMPVRQAFQKLRSEGLLIIEKGKRPVIGNGRMPWNFQELRGFSEEMRRRGLLPSARVLSREELVASGEVARALSLQSGETVYRIERLRSVNGEPVAIDTDYLPSRLFPRFEQQNLENASLHAIFESVYNLKLHWAEEIIGAVAADWDVAKLLETEPGSALLIIHETTYDTNRIAIAYSRSLLRGDRYTASVISVRKRPSR